MPNVRQFKPPICPETPKVFPSSLSSCEVGWSGMHERGPSFREDCFPAWLDIHKFRHGQKFVLENWRSYEIGFASTLAGLLALPGLSNVLHFTELNDCPASASKRYITTLGNNRIWATADIERKKGTEALLLSTRKVREVHAHMGERVQKAEELHGKKLRNDILIKNASLQEGVWAAMKQDLSEAYSPEELIFSECYNDGLKKYRYVNQFEYAMTLWTMSAVFTPPLSKILFPKASEKTLEATNHYWAVVGWLVGINDEFNIGLQRNIDSYTKYYKALCMKYIVPALYNINTISKHFTEVTLYRITPYFNVLPSMPDSLPLDAYLMLMLRLALGIPYENLYKAASAYGRSLIDALNVYFLQSSTLSLQEPYVKEMPDSVHDAWGTKTFGPCYTKWTTDADKAKYLHYKYDGPVVNPYGIHSNCNKTTKC